MLKQYELLEPESESHMVCWLALDPRVKIGSMIKLKDIPDRIWIVSKIYEGSRDRADIKRGWNNNI
tara:strand:+ start:407 stop:604 length:198 start_codon:yes stop_codon:yes gene_type:complete